MRIKSATKSATNQCETGVHLLLCDAHEEKKKSHNHKFFLQLWDFCFGDSYGNRTRVTAVKGRCLSRLTNEPYVVAEVGFEPTTIRV